MIGPVISRLRANPIAARIMRNLAWIFLSQGAIALFGMVTLAVSARALGAAGLGVLAVIEAYTRIVARLTHLEPWQAVIRHGSTAIEDSDDDRLEGLIGLSIVIDLAGGVLAAVVAFAVAQLFAPVLGLDAAEARLLSFAALSALISFRATGIAVLRLYDRFDLLAKVDIALAFGRLALSLLAYALGGGLGAFVAVFVAFSLADGLFVYLFARREMGRRGHRPTYRRLRASLAKNPGFLRLMWNANLSVIWRQSTQRLDTILLATLLPPTAIGYYHIARRLGDAAFRLGRPLNQALYPEQTRLAARGDHAGIRRLVLMTTLGFAAALLVALPPILWQIEQIVTLLFGPAFAPAGPVVAIQSVAVALTLVGVILGPTLLSLGEDVVMVRVSALCAILFFVLLVPFASAWGVEGAAITRLVTNAVWLIAMAWFLHQALRRKGAEPSPSTVGAEG